MRNVVFRRAGCLLAGVLAAFCLAGCTDGAQDPPPDTGGEEPVQQERVIEAVNPADKGTAVLANATIAAFCEDYKAGRSKEFVDPTAAEKKDSYAPAGVLLTWTCKEAAEEYTVTLSSAEDMAGAAEYRTTEAQLQIDDLFVATGYYWQVEAQTADGTIRSDVFRFTTAETPRTLSIEGVSNTRDIGGYAAADGKRVKQGMILRGGKLEDITENGKNALLNTYKVRTDLDLRRLGEASNVLGEAVQYIQIASPAYTTPNGDSGIDVAANNDALASIIRVFAEEENYPVYMHCSIGRDRTGTIALLLGLLLGVGEDDIDMDYELSLFSAAGCSDDTTFNSLYYTYFWPTYYYIDQNFSGSGMAQKCEQFLLSVGVTADEIASIRALLLV